MNKSTVENILSNLKGCFSEHNLKYYYVDRFFEGSKELVFIYPLPKKCIDPDLAVRMITGSKESHIRLLGGLFLNDFKKSSESFVPLMKDRVYFEGGLMNCCDGVKFSPTNLSLFSFNGKVYFDVFYTSGNWFNYFFFSHCEEFRHHYYLNCLGIHCLEKTVIQPYSYVFGYDKEEED